MKKFLGMLSAKYESNGKAGCISNTKGDAGGKSYGAYQFAIAFKIPQEFVKWLKSVGNKYGVRLSKYEVGSVEFDREWQAIGKEDPEGFFNAQHDYVKREYYDRAIAILAKNYCNVEKHSFAFRNVVWSIAVQYSPYRTATLLNEACKIVGYANLSYIDSIKWDEKIIKAIYEVRASDKWTSGSPSLRQGLRNRFTNECQDALKLLKEEIL